MYFQQGLYDDAMSSFFRNVDSRDDHDIPLGNSKGKIKSLKARVGVVVGILSIYVF